MLIKGIELKMRNESMDVVPCYTLMLAYGSTGKMGDDRLHFTLCTILPSDRGLVGSIDVPTLGVGKCSPDEK